MNVLGSGCSSGLWPLAWDLQLLHLNSGSPWGATSAPLPVLCPGHCLQAASASSQRAHCFPPSLRDPSSLTDARRLTNCSFYVYCLVFSLFTDVSGRRLQLTPVTPSRRQRKTGRCYSQPCVPFPVLLRPLEPVPLMLNHPPVSSTVSASSRVVF